MIRFAKNGTRVSGHSYSVIADATKQTLRVIAGSKCLQTCLGAAMLFLGAAGQNCFSDVKSGPTPGASPGPIHWCTLQIPTGEAMTLPQILREGLGFVRSTGGVLWRYKDGVWDQVTPAGAEEVSRYYVLSEDNIWVSAKVSGSFREALFHFDGQRWKRVPSPHLHNIRAIYFESPQNGWIGCEYGEIWHFNGSEWLREEIPVFLHIHQFARRWNGELLAGAEAPGQSALLWRHDGRWQLVTRSLEGHSFAVGPNDLIIGLTGLGSKYTPKYFEAPPFKVCNLGARSMDFLPDGSGYALQEDSLFYFDGNDFHFVPGNMWSYLLIDLFSPAFSWIVGPNGFILSPGKSRGADDIPVAYGQQPPALELDYQKVYGIGIIQEAPAKPCYIMLVRSGEPNVVLGAREFEKGRDVSAKADSAAELNLQGSVSYAASERLGTTSRMSAFDQGIVVGDLSNDGLEDVIVSSLYGHPDVHLNSGRDYFFEATGYAGLLEWGSPKLRPTQPALSDVDHDGDVDLFVSCQYGSNSLFVNDGYGRFREVTVAAGLSTPGGGLSATFLDIDNDGWDDLYVGCTNGPNRLYRNMGAEAASGLPRFVDYSGDSRDACWQKLEETTCVVAGDYDNDGDFDLVVFSGVSDARLLVNDGAGYFAVVRDPVVLPDNAVAQAGAFVDFDNDGYLDLAVASHGPNSLFWGSSTRKFRHEVQQGYLDLPTYHSMNYQNPSGQLSNSLAVVDIDHDRDLDIFVGNYETGSFFFGNSLNSRPPAIQIFPAGVYSNCSAIGTKVFLYDGGHVGEMSHARGSRSIQAGTAGGSSDEKVAHFGVQPDGVYDVRVVFPSGVVRDVVGLRAGARLVVREAEGFWANAHMLWLRARNFVRGYRSELRLYQLLGLVLLVGVGVLVGRRYWMWSRSEVVGFGVVVAVSFAASALLVFYRSDRGFLLWPLLVSLVGGAAVVVIDRFRGLYGGRGASFEALQSRLSAFGHGTLAHDVMQGVLMYAVNLREGGQVASGQVRGLQEAADEMLAVVGAEVRAILSYLRSTHFAVDKAARLNGTWRPLRLCLERLRRGDLGVRLLEGVAEAIPRLKQEVRELQVELEEFFSCSVTEALANAVKRHQKDGKVVVLEVPEEELPLVRFQRGDLVYLVDELIANALAASNGLPLSAAPAEVCVRCFQRFDEVMIDICDRGRGISRELWEEIFKETFTTKPASMPGGFGLYYTRRMAERYGGQIYVQESEVGKGTVMRLCLRIAKPPRLQAKAGH